MTIEDLIVQMITDIKAIAKFSVDDDIDIAAAALKAAVQLYDFKNELEKWHAHEWDWPLPEASPETGDVAK